MKGEVSLPPSVNFRADHAERLSLRWKRVVARAWMAQRGIKDLGKTAPLTRRDA